MKEQVSRLVTVCRRPICYLISSHLAKRVKHWSRAWDGKASDQARDLVKNCFEGRPLCVPFKTAPLHPGSWIKWLGLCGESESYWERVIWWYFARIKSGNIVPGCLWIVLSVPQTWLTVWFPEVVDRQISGMSWRSCYNWRILCKCWAPPLHMTHTHTCHRQA